MSENKQNEVLTGYEQLKRRNRRRLVTASCLVAASCLLLAAALSSDPAENPPAAPTDETGSMENQAASTVQTPTLKSASEGVEPAADKPQDLAGEEPAPAADNGISEPEDVGAPLVIINDRLDDSNIKGLEASEKLQQEEAAKTAQAEAKQRAAEKAQVTVDNKDTVEKPKQAAESKPQKTERAAESKPKTKEPAQKTADKVSEKPKTLPEKSKSDSTKSDKVVKEPKKSDKAESKKPVEKEGSDGKKHETASKADKAKTAEHGKTAEKEKSEKSGKKSAIQAGYAEKERALSLQRKMKAAGIDSTITEIMTDNGKVYRVKSSNYKNARDAERDLNKLRVHGIAGQVTNE
ncbi:cell division protein FtsN [Neisseria cinerea]|uniref:cell division protein FtsN n=1 Tax=Neisseria cinerea TaxID=483 RepID=UPI00288A70F2|nr:cell division protein FtsN [Neisseria cinerea]